MFEHSRKLEKVRVYRYGGEEFLILFANENRKTVIDFLTDLRLDIEKTPIQHDTTSICITISIGLAFSAYNDSVATFVERADMAVYQAKENGRNRLEIGIENATMVEYVAEELPSPVREEPKLTMGFVL